MKNLFGTTTDVKQLVFAFLLSLLMVAYGPLVTMTSAQSATNAKITQLKEKAGQEIDRRLTDLKKTLKSLESDIKLENDKINDAIATNSGGTDTTTKVELQGTVKTQVRDSLQKMIDKLTVIREKVASASTLSEIEELGKSIDSQFQLDQVTNAQGAVTKSIESLTGVFDKLKTTAKNIQSQVTKVKECTSSESAQTAEGCEKVNNEVAKDTATNAQSQMDNIKTILSTIGTVLMSAITLLATLVLSFSGIAGSLGSLTSLGDVSGNSSLSGLTGIMSSFTAITSQLDIAGGMGGNAQGLLGSLSGLTSGFGF